MEKNYLFFDLDGTIIESKMGIIQSVEVALAKLEWPKLDQATLTSFIGPPLIDSLLRIGMTKEQAEAGVAYYREDYLAHGLLAVDCFPGVVEMLAEFTRQQKKMYIATSKPEIFAKKILAHLELTDYFTGIYGAALAGERQNKTAVLAYALQEAGVADKQQAAMIGDRQDDMIGAVKNGISGIGVLYGYGSRQELQAAGAETLVETPMKLVELLGN